MVAETQSENKTSSMKEFEILLNEDFKNRKFKEKKQKRLKRFRY